jgi:hypothetical protein
MCGKGIKIITAFSQKFNESRPFISTNTHKKSCSLKCFQMENLFLIEFHFRLFHTSKTGDHSHFHHWRARISAENRLFPSALRHLTKDESPYITGWKLNIFSELFQLMAFGIWGGICWNEKSFFFLLYFFSFTHTIFWAIESFVVGRTEPSWPHAKKTIHGKFFLEAKLGDLHIFVMFKLITHSTPSLFCRYFCAIFLPSSEIDTSDTAWCLS